MMLSLHQEPPLISVVMSVYNGGEYLSSAIESVLDQSYKEFEFIIIDDGSNDGSLEIIKSYQAEDDRIVLITRENRGLIASLNEGIDLARGEYIARMDADDISLPTRFAKQVAFMEANPNIGICGSWVEVFGDDRRTKVGKMAFLDKELKTKLLFSVPVMHPTVMVRRDLLCKYDLRYHSDYKTAEDYKMWLDCAEFTEFANLQEVLLRYRVLESSITRIAEAAKDNARFEVMNKIFWQVLSKMGIQNSVDENRLHFTLQLNDRIAREDIDLRYLDRYLNKLLDANRSSKVFHQGYLEQLLVKKFLVVIYYKIKRRDLSFLHSLLYKKFWLGVWFMLR